MNHIFNNMEEKLKAIQELKEIGIEGQQAIDIVFESVKENEHVQLMQQVFKVAFLYGQLHQYNKRNKNYHFTDAQAQEECVKTCTEIIKA